MIQGGFFAFANPIFYVHIFLVNTQLNANVNTEIGMRFKSFYVLARES